MNAGTGVAGDTANIVAVGAGDASVRLAVHHGPALLAPDSAADPVFLSLDRGVVHVA